MSEQEHPQLERDESETAKVDPRFDVIIARGREVLMLREARKLRVADRQADIPANPTKPLDLQEPR
jgi:hypothetical protein